jgi:Fur family ferric uptake transcriptional regulator
MAAAPGPMSAAELSDLLGAEVPLSSLYRTLAILEDAGVAVHHLAAKGLTRYELAEWLMGHHHHLVCVVCGSVADVEIPEGEEGTLRALVSGIARRNGFTPTDHALEIEGRCAECS